MIAEVVTLPVDHTTIEGDLRVPEDAIGVVVFAHGSGSSRFSPRNRAVAEALEQHAFGTLLLDLLTRDEDVVDAQTGEFRFDIVRLANRVVQACDWLRSRLDLSSLPLGCFGASTGAAAALIAAAERPADVRAVVSRGGRPDLAGAVLASVRAPTLLIVGSADEVVIELNRRAMAQMRTRVELRLVPGATHLFAEPGALEQVAKLAGDWFTTYLRA
jgi:putative phosphoribosyl transferase